MRRHARTGLCEQAQALGRRAHRGRPSPAALPAAEVDRLLGELRAEQVRVRAAVAALLDPTLLDPAPVG